MDFSKITNFGDNYVLSNDEVQELIKKKIINPFVPQMSNGLTPIYVLKKEDLKLIGEGGMGSGKDLPTEFGTIKEPTELRKERRRQQLKNAQKKYRETNRDEYNKTQNKYYKKMKEDYENGINVERYENWIANMKIANDRYKLKKQYVKDLGKKKREAEKEAKKLWKAKNKGVRGRPKKGEIKVSKQIDEAWVKMKADELYAEKIKDLQKQGGIVEKELKPNKDGKMTYQYPSEINEANAKLTYPYVGDDKVGYSADNYIEYDENKKVPKEVKKAYRKKKGLPEEEPEKKKKEKKVKEAPKPKELTQEEKEIELLKQYNKEKEPFSSAVLTSKSVREALFGSKKFQEWYKGKTASSS